MLNNEPNDKPMTGQEFIAIMVAAVIIVTPLILTNQPPSRNVPVYVGQAAGIQWSTDPHQSLPQDFSHGSLSAADSFNTARVAQPFEATQGSGYGTWSCGISNSFTSAMSWVGNFFGGMGRWLSPESPY